MKKFYAINVAIIALLAVAISAFAGPEVESKGNLDEWQEARQVTAHITSNIAWESKDGKDDRDDDDDDDRGGQRHRAATYEVTISNLTPGQPLTPPVVATHQRRLHMFRVGRAASFELKEIAENGNGMPMLDALGANKRVFESQQVGMVPLVPTADPGGTGLADSVTFNISAARSAKYFSFASMLICSNDGFTGIDGLRLPRKVGQSKSVTSNGYDAGTEINTEDFANMVPPCPGLTGVSSDEPGTGMSDPALLEGGVVMHHPGIQGIDDLVPEVHGWADPVALVTITRID